MVQIEPEELAQRSEKPLELVGDHGGLPPVCLGAGESAVAGLELRIVPELLEHGDPRRDLACGGNLKGVWCVAGWDRKHESGDTHAFRARPRGRWPGPGCR